MFDIFILNPTQKIMFYSTVFTGVIQLLCLFYFKELRKNMNLNYSKCFLYIVFSSIAYLFYLNIMIPN